MSEKTKAYGLILPQKKSEQIKAKPAQLNVFGSDSDEDDKPSLHGSIFGPNTGPSKIKRQAQVDIDKALLEDPNIYEYDAVYDEVQASKPKVGAQDKDKNNIDKKPKYIMGLLKAAEQKKKEEEKRKERKVQKEREAEGEMFADKEKFVTSAYKQKMLEMQEEEEKERRVAAFEVMTDVTKQKDMSGFYRYLYRETTGDQAKTDESVNQEQKDAGSAEVKVEPDDSPRQKPRSSPGTPAESASSGSESETEAAVPKSKSGLFKANRPNTGNNYRKRKADSSDSDEKRENAKGRKSSHIKKRHSLSRSKSRSPRRSKNNRNYSRKDSSPSQVRRRRSKSHSSSPVVDRRKRDKSRSRERIKKDHSREESSRKNKHQRSRERSRRSRSTSREKLRSSRSGEKSRRSRSRDKSKKSHSSDSRSNIERGGHSKSDLVDLGRKHKSSRSSSSGEDHGQEKLRHKPTNETKSQTSGKPEIRKKDKGIEKSQKGDSEISSAAQASGNDDTDSAEKDKPGKSGNGNLEKPADKPSKPPPVDPAKKVYPHHNSLKDIEEARKRYLQRKAAQEGVA